MARIPVERSATACPTGKPNTASSFFRSTNEPDVAVQSIPRAAASAIAGYWIAVQQRNPLDPSRPTHFFVEEERSASGEVVPVATILLTNRECPWRCLMCDLWRNTLTETVPAGAIPTQIDYALERLPQRVRSSSTTAAAFSIRAPFPSEDYPAIAQSVSGFDRVIVECHPALVGEDCFRFSDSSDGTLEVAMGWRRRIRRYSRS